MTLLQKIAIAYAIILLGAASINYIPAFIDEAGDIVDRGSPQKDQGVGDGDLLQQGHSLLT